MSTAAELPDPTAVLVAVWRAKHLVLDPEPHVFVDDVGIRLADTPEALSGLDITHDPAGTWLGAPLFTGPAIRPYRALMIARARMTEDLLAASGIDQLVILGAGLDSTALRRTDRRELSVYEVEQPGPQRWKQRRLAELDIALPPGLRFVPVDFQSGEDWLELTVAAGLDRTRAVFLTALGLTQYIDPKATTTLFERAASLGPGTTIVVGFNVPDELVDPAELAYLRATLASFDERGCPWVARYRPEEFVAIAAAAGFDELDVVTPDQLSARCFGGRSDGLRSHSAEYFLVARRLT